MKKGRLSAGPSMNGVCFITDMSLNESGMTVTMMVIGLPKRSIIKEKS